MFETITNFFRNYKKTPKNIFKMSQQIIRPQNILSNTTIIGGKHKRTNKRRVFHRIRTINKRKL